MNQWALSSKGKYMDKFRTTATVFAGATISPRLVSHSLLHGLIRMRKLDQASALAEHMMQAGISVRCKTLEHLFSQLSDASTSNLPPGLLRPQLPTTLALERPDVLHLRPDMSFDPSTRFAIGLLMVARQSRQKRSHKMFKTLITMCIINGEIILASLIFGICLRDWASKEQERLRAASPAAPQLPSTGHQVASISKWRTGHETPSPSWHLLKQILRPIDEVLLDEEIHPPGTKEVVEWQYRSALQALVNLANMFNQNPFPFKNIVPLLLSFTRVPKGMETAWVCIDEAQPKNVQAYSFIHGVLKKFIMKLPIKDDNNIKGLRLQQVLDIQTTNSLLHYSLRNHRSLAMAEKTLSYALQGEGVNTVTMNIIARESTLLRDSRVVQLAFNKMGGDSTKPSASDPVSALLDIAEKAGDNYNYTLSTRIAHLIATGNPQVVVDAIPRLLPGIAPSLSLPPKSTFKARQKLRREGLRRAVELGPVVLTSLLNALVKAGHTGLAEKVWRWAKAAEAASWSESWTMKHDNQDFPDIHVIEPWCLPIQAYTIMMKVYAKEVKRVSGRVKGWGAGATPEAKHALWSSKHKRKASAFRRAMADMWSSRAEMGRYMGLRLYRLMNRSSAIIEARKESLRARLDACGGELTVILHNKQMQVPKADARWFNATLSVVRGALDNPSRQARQRTRRSRAWFKSQAYRLRRRYLWSGELPAHRKEYASGVQHQALHMVGRDMVKTGFPIPLLYQRLLIGKWNVHAKEHSSMPEGLVGKRRVRDRSPFAKGGCGYGPLEGDAGRATLRIVNTKSKYGK